MNTQPSNAGPHVKDLVATAYPGEVPDDVERVCEGNVKVEYMPATAPKDPRTSKPVVTPANTDKITRANELTADEDKMSQISTSAGDTLGGATSKDLYHGTGKPVQGLSSVEMHHDGRPGRKREGGGTAQFGPQGGPVWKYKDC